ncbi:hypothetical protein SLE2022_235400 [Rubroshorea leprosula]
MKGMTRFFECRRSLYGMSFGESGLASEHMLHLRSWPEDQLPRKVNGRFRGNLMPELKSQSLIFSNRSFVDNLAMFIIRSSYAVSTPASLFYSVFIM